MLQRTENRATDKKQRRSKRRLAFTLIELITIIAMVTILISLLMPAVQSVRESARKTQCQNRLRQVGLAMQMHHDPHGCWPHNGGWDGSQTILDSTGVPFVPATTDFSLGQTFQWGASDPMRHVKQQTGSWLYSVLPYLEQEQLHSSPKWNVALPTVICPSRRSVKTVSIVASDGFGQYASGGWEWAKTDYAANSLLVPGVPGQPPTYCRRKSHVKDGLSSTILIGEKAFDPDVSGGQTWYWDEPFMLGGSAGTIRWGVSLQADGAGIDYKRNWGAAHFSGVNFAWCDGSVRMLPFATPSKIVRTLLTPRGNEPVAVP